MNVQKRAFHLVDSAIEAANPGRLITQNLIPNPNGLLISGHSYNQKRVTLVSVGKAAVPMAQAAVSQLGERLKQGIVVGKIDKATLSHPKLQYHQGSHPIPDQRSLNATSAVKEMLAASKADELVLCLISGGTSALLTEPVLALPHWQQLNEALLASGCPINDINTIRQRFDAVKGGGLAQWAAPAICESLILSDVIGNHLEHIGSGPTVFVEQRSNVVKAVFDRNNIWNWLKPETAALIKTHLETPNTPSPINKIVSPSTRHTIIGDVSNATNAVFQQTAEWGFESTIVSNNMTGEAREIGRMAAKYAKNMPSKSCLIWGGESTVTLRGNGRGGRNQEIALAAAISLQNTPNCAIVAFSTDAEDGPMPVAGAYVTGETFSQAKQQGLDPYKYLANNDSYTFFERLGIGHITAQTGTNVNDVLALLKE